MFSPIGKLSPGKSVAKDLGSDTTSYANLPIGPAVQRRAGVRRALRREDLTPSVIARFQSKIHKTDSCWLWTGTKERNGYGQVYIGREADGRLVRFYAHRVAYALEHGTFPKALEVMHRCDVPGCVNPDHLVLGTHHDNMLDRMAKGRAARTKPTIRKISVEDVALIRSRLDIKSAEWARQLGVCVSHINRIRRGEKRKAA
jgi:hypothetical protein